MEKIRLQVEKMKIGARMIFKPKLILHFKETIDENGRAFIIVKPCGFCNERFHCMDVAVTFYRHTFCPLHLGAMSKDSNKCCVCNVRLHHE
jgi:hypothetical protein